MHDLTRSFTYRFLNKHCHGFQSCNKNHPAIITFTPHSFKYFYLMGRIIQIQFFSAAITDWYHSITQTVLSCVSEAINTVFLAWGFFSSLPAKWNGCFGIKSLKSVSQTLQKGTHLRQASKWSRFYKSRTVAGRAAENLQCCWPVGRDRLH